LKGSLDLSDFVNLEELNCSDNKLTSLDVSRLDKLRFLSCCRNGLTNLKLNNCSNITHLGAFENNLTKVDFSALDSEKVIIIDFSSNYFLSSDLSIFSCLVNLETLLLHATSFSGSLGSLQNLTKLKALSIADTDIDEGLEYLPTSVENIYCNVKNTRIKEQLSPYAINEQQSEYNLKAWRKDNQRLIDQIEGSSAQE